MSKLYEAIVRWEDETGNIVNYRRCTFPQTKAELDSLLAELKADKFVHNITVKYAKEVQ